VALALFDLDKTLLGVNSATLWVRREVALGQMKKRRALSAMLWLATYQLGLFPAEELVAKAISEVKGVPLAELEARTRSFYDTHLRRAFRPGGLDVLSEHRAQGDVCVLLTSSSHMVADLAAQQLGLDGVLCNQLEVAADGRLTGRAVGRICYGAGKLFHAQAEAERRGLPLSGATFYTDSYTDLPVLEAVKHPVAVNPDVRLRRHAERVGWPIADWGRPLDRVA